MLRKIKILQPARFYLTQVSQQNSLSGLPGFQKINPGNNGEFLLENVTELARQGIKNCFILTGPGMKSKIYLQLPVWIRQLKMDHPQMDFHIHSGRRV